MTFRYTAGPYRIEANYETRPEWRFVAKRLLVSAPAGSRFRVNSVEVFRATLGEPVRESVMPGCVGASLPGRAVERAANIQARRSFQAPQPSNHRSHTIRPRAMATDHYTRFYAATWQAPATSR